MVKATVRFAFVRVLIIAALLYTLVRQLTSLPDRPIPQQGSTNQYFHEVSIEWNTTEMGSPRHYGAEFAPEHGLNVNQTQQALAVLYESFAALMAKLEVRFWIMHGTLLGWHWNQRLLPWDTDIDVQMSPGAIEYLAKYHNMTQFNFTVSSEEDGLRTYLLDINPYYSVTSFKDTANKIDGRYLDKGTGLYVDITVAHVSERDPNMLFSKDGHQYYEGDVLPLRQTEFEGVPTWVPFDPPALLQKEYGRKALTKKNFHWYSWDDEKKRWIYRKKKALSIGWIWPMLGL